MTTLIFIGLLPYFIFGWGALFCVISGKKKKKPHGY